MYEHVRQLDELNITGEDLTLHGQSIQAGASLLLEKDVPLGSSSSGDVQKFESGQRHEQTLDDGK